MKPSTGAAVRLHRNAVRDRPESLFAFKWNACPPSPEYPPMNTEPLEVGDYLTATLRNPAGDNAWEAHSDSVPSNWRILFKKDGAREWKTGDEARRVSGVNE